MSMFGLVVPPILHVHVLWTGEKVGLVSHLGKRFNNFKCLYDPQDSIQNWYQTTALYTVMEFELMDIYQI